MLCLLACTVLVCGRNTWTAGEKNNKHQTKLQKLRVSSRQHLASPSKISSKITPQKKKKSCDMPNLPAKNVLDTPRNAKTLPGDLCEIKSMLHSMAAKPGVFEAKGDGLYAPQAAGMKCRDVLKWEVAFFQEGVVGCWSPYRVYSQVDFQGFMIFMVLCFLWSVGYQGVSSHNHISLYLSDR